MIFKFVIALFVFASVCAPSFAADSDPLAFLVTPGDSVGYYQKLERANQQFAEQKWTEAGSIFTELVRAYPLSGTVWGQLAISLRKQNKHEEAIRAYEKVMAIQGPGQIYNARYWIAASHAALGHTDAALHTLQQLVFSDAYVNRPDLLGDSAFAKLKNNPRFQKIAGKEDVSHLDRNEGWRRDIDYLIEELKRTNPSNAPIPKEVFQRQHELKESVPKLSDLEIIGGLTRIIAPLGRGHTQLWYGAPGAKIEIKALPIHFYQFPEGIFVIEASQGHEDLVGAEVLQFGKIPSAEALKQVSSGRSSESPMENLWVVPHILELPAILNGLGIIQQTDRIQLTLKMTDGKVVVKTVEGIPMTSAPNLKLNAPPRVKPPLFLQNLKELHWFQALPEHDAIYVQVNNIMPDQDETLQQFGLRLRKAIAEIKPNNIILDIRHNNGGNVYLCRSSPHIDGVQYCRRAQSVCTHRTKCLLGSSKFYGRSRTDCSTNFCWGANESSW
jgi:tetratricopeptide (TPR) repeat protein